MRYWVYVSLRQHHLPRLEDAGLVTFDRDEGTLVATDELRSLRPHRPTGPDGFEARGTGESLVARADESAPADAPPTNPRSGTGDPGRSPERADTTVSHPVWFPYYALLCVGSWILATVDALDLVAYEFITTSEWILVFLLILSVLVVLQFQSEREYWNSLPVLS